MKKFIIIITIALYAASGGAVFAATETPVAQSETHAATETTTNEEAHTEATEEHAEETGVVGMFGLNWKLLLAQLINFGIILFVLWKWVFGPVTKGLADRTAKIEGSLVEAQRITEERQTFDSWKQGEIAQVRQEAAGIITQAKSEAEKLRSDMLAQTKIDQDKIAQQMRGQLEQEKKAILQEAKVEIADIIVTASESILKAKLDAKKDGELIKQALKDAGAGA